MISSLQPISWFAVNVNPKTIDVLRRYIAVTVTPASLSSLASSKTRKRRATYSAGKINVVIGVQTGCEKKIKPEDICNGPLKPNKEYRYKNMNNLFLCYLYVNSKIDSHMRLLPEEGMMLFLEPLGFL